MAHGPPVVRFERISKQYVMGEETVHALIDVDVVVNEGEFVAIMGPSGSGKSTLLNLLGCLDKPTTGAYFLGETDVARMSDDEISRIRNERIGFIFQSFNLIPALTVLENIEVPFFYAGVGARAARQKARDLAARVGLAKRIGHRPTQLSGGQQQRVAIARALANNPFIILADEPTGNLDSATGLEIMEILAELHRAGKTIIMVTHEDDIAACAERTIHMRDGRVVEEQQVA
jgi:putative ABC transport system ATP-binding protein